MEQQVKDLVLSLQWFRLLLWCGFDPWPRSFHMLMAWPKRKKKARFIETESKMVTTRTREGKKKELF